MNNQIRLSHFFILFALLILSFHSHASAPETTQSNSSKPSDRDAQKEACKISARTLIREVQAMKDKQFIGRAKELAQLDRIIERNRHALIIGDSGSGKTSLVEFLSQQVEAGNVRSLQPERTIVKTLEWRALTATQDLLTAERETPELFLMREVFQAKSENKKLILHIPEFNELMADLEGANASARRALAARIRILMMENEITVIAETTKVSEAIENDPGYRLFDRLNIKPLSRNDMLASLAMEATRLGQEAEVKFFEDSLTAALDIAERNFPGDALLTRAKELLREAAMDLKRAQEGAPIAAGYIEFTIAEYRRILELVKQNETEYPDLVRRLQIRITELEAQLTKEVAGLESSKDFHEKIMATNRALENLLNQKEREKDFNRIDALDRQIEEQRKELEALSASLSQHSQDANIFDPTFVTPNLIVGVASRNLDRPVRYNSQEAADFAGGLLPYLKSRIFGQDAQLTEVAELVGSRIIRSNDPRRKNPLVIEAMGPTGTGKTELAKGLAEYLTGSEENLVKFSGTEFMESHSVARFIGAPPGYAGFDGELGGAQLVKAIKENPEGIFLLDEWHLYHPDIRRALMDMFDSGVLKSGTGETVDASRATFVLANNFGEELYAGAVDPQTGKFSAEGRQAIMDKRQSQSSEAELARINVLLWEPIPKDVAERIVDRELSFLDQREANLPFTIEIGDDVRNQLYQDAYSVGGGVRRLKDKIDRQIQRHIDRRIYGPRETRPRPGAKLIFKVVDEQIVLVIENP